LRLARSWTILPNTGIFFICGSGSSLTRTL
jgi:hypothetical protein